MNLICIEMVSLLLCNSSMLFQMYFYIHAFLLFNHWSKRDRWLKFLIQCISLFAPLKSRLGLIYLLFKCWIKMQGKISLNVTFWTLQHEYITATADGWVFMSSEKETWWKYFPIECISHKVYFNRSRVFFSLKNNKDSVHNKRDSVTFFTSLEVTSCLDRLVFNG